MRQSSICVALRGCATTLLVTICVVGELSAQQSASTLSAQDAVAATPPPARRGPWIPPPKVIATRDAQPYAPGDFDERKPGLPTLIMAGDSTAPTGPDAWHRGWFAPTIDYFDTDKINIVNRARGGRSFRSFVREGLWDELVANINPGDIVLIQFGHNDGGDIHATNGRGDLPGMGDETADVERKNRDGTTFIETVHTFGWYARKYVRDVKAKGGKPILLSTTVWGAFDDEGNVIRPMNNGRLGNKMYTWIRQIAQEEDVPWLDHGQAIADSFQSLGANGIRPFFQADRLHTTTFGAINNCEAFIAVIKAMPALGLAKYLNDAGRAILPWTPSAVALAVEKEMQP